MILHSAVKSLEDGQICVAAQFEMQRPIAYLPSSLWYRFPERYVDRLNSRADAFAPTALLVAMYAGEDLYIHGEISPRLAYHLREYRDVFHAWYPKTFKRVDVQYELPASLAVLDGERAVGAAFSGGVDSFYSLWSHLAQNQSIREARATHGLFVHGLDLRLDDDANYRSAADVYSRMFDKLGLELIEASTNAYQFSEFRINWTMFFGAPMIGAGLLLGPWMGRFYVPSGMPSYRGLFPQGSSPLIDHLLSTEATEIVHHGSSVSRYEKVVALSSWAVTYDKLRVCSDKTRPYGLGNCCTCHKCYRTMILLEIQGVSNDYKAFSRKMNPIDFLRWGALLPLNLNIESEIRNLAFRKGRIWIGVWLQVAMILYVFQKVTLGLFKNFLSEEQLFRLKRKIFIPESREENRSG
jgi:hypothetical protein